jgi:glycerol-3-phosphate dehydrogenase
MPIAAAVGAVLAGEIDAREAVTRLLSRARKRED